MGVGSSKELPLEDPQGLLELFAWGVWGRVALTLWELVLTAWGEHWLPGHQHSLPRNYLLERERCVLGDQCSLSGDCLLVCVGNSAKPSYISLLFEKYPFKFINLPFFNIKESKLTYFIYKLLTFIPN